MDEIALKKGYKDFLTVLSTPYRILDVLKGRDTLSVKPFLEQINLSMSIKFVIIDMSTTFFSIIKKVMPNVTVVIDRFHIIQNMNKNLIKQNKKSYKLLDEKERKPFRRIWHLLSKNKKKISREQSRLINLYFELNPYMEIIYDEAQEFREILLGSQGQEREKVEQKIIEWINKASLYYVEFCKTLQNWFNEIVNACIYPYSNARQEGLNNSAKLVKRRGRGFSNIENFALRLQAECS